MRTVSSICSGQNQHPQSFVAIDVQDPQEKCMQELHSHSSSWCDPSLNIKDWASVTSQGLLTSSPHHNRTWRLQLLQLSDVSQLQRRLQSITNLQLSTIHHHIPCQASPMTSLLSFVISKMISDQFHIISISASNWYLAANACGKIILILVDVESDVIQGDSISLIQAISEC